MSEYIFVTRSNDTMRSSGLFCFEALRMKRLPVTAAVATLVVLIMFSLTAHVTHADVVDLPVNDFLAQHESQVVFLGRIFVANGEDGGVDVKEAPVTEPEAGKTIARLENGEMTFMDYSCLYNEDFWGYASGYYGWVELDQMLVMYDYIAFEEDHLDELYSYNGDYEKIKETRSAIVWLWPGSGTLLWTLEDLDMESFKVLYAYKDEEGREWGFVSYLYSLGNIWVCLSDPLNRDLPASGPAEPYVWDPETVRVDFNQYTQQEEFPASDPMPEPYVWVSETPHIDIKQNTQQEEFPVMIIIIVLVAALVSGTTVLIRVFWKEDRTRWR